MKVTSEKKAAAARANGALSRGPITPEGKARSAQNALQHGLFSDTVVLACEDPEEFRALFIDYCDYYQPVGRVEHEIVSQIAACVWRMRRAYAMETLLLDKAAGAITYGKSAGEKLVDGYFNVSDSAGAKSLDRLQARLDRTQSRLIHDLFFVRRQLKRDAVTAEPEPEPAPEPIPEPESPAAPDPAPPAQELRNEPITPCVSNPSIPPQSARSLAEREPGDPGGFDLSPTGTTPGRRR
jgi:hypothetical protein